MSYIDLWNGLPAGWSGTGYRESRICNCRGPQNGNPVCPCMMPAHLEREAGRWALEALGALGGRKPRVRVKAGRRVQ